MVRLWIPTESCPDGIADGLVMRYEREGSGVIPKVLLSVTVTTKLPPLKLEVCRQSRFFLCGGGRDQTFSFRHVKYETFISKDVELIMGNKSLELRKWV